MNRFNSLGTPIVILAAALILGACGSDKSTSFAPFEPEIINNVDAFEFQITDADGVSRTVSYPWENTGTQATVDHSTVVNSGSATMTILDQDGTQVYTSGLLASGNELTASGTTGSWTIRIVFDDFSGTANFRVVKATP